MAGRWIVQSLPSLINSDTNPPQFFVINSRGRHFSNYEEATAECDKLNAEEAAAEKLRAASLASESRSDWISVTERLPEASREVLVYGCQRNIAVAWTWKELQRNGNPPVMKWAWDEGTLSGVTHWMELPKGPEA